MECTVNCGGTHCFHYINMILCITDLVSCDVECGSCSYVLIVGTVKVFLQ